jgi:dihydrodipicolinate synthase/N-acetylneuraminate lyase
LKTSAVSPADLSRSVIAVPPLARHGDLTLNREANVAMIRHLERGGVSTLLYGGNANLYNIGLYEYGALLDMLEQTASATSWVIPSAGPDFGKLLDQAQVLRSRAFPTAMVLPQTFPATPDGSEKAIRMFAERYGRPVIVYLKAESFLTPSHVARLVDAGMVSGIKYAIVRGDPAVDSFLKELLDRVDAALVISGIGERPAPTHLRQFGLAGFTSGSVCVGPRGSTRLLATLKSGDWTAAEALRSAYLPLEDLRDAHSPIRVLHEAVSLAGIADMGPLLPQLSNIGAEHHGAIRVAARALLAHDAALPSAAGPPQGANGAPSGGSAAATAASVGVQ